MKFTSAFTYLALAAGFASVTASPIQTRTTVPAEVAILQSFGTAVQGDILKAVADPVGYLIPETRNWIGNKLSTQSKTALAALVAAPTSSNPLATVISGDGPLIKTLTNSVFYLLIDLKLDSEKIAGPFLPGYTAFAQGLDSSTYQIVEALNDKYKGFTTSLANAIGADTTLGKDLKLIGGSTFTLLFDHI